MVVVCVRVRVCVSVVWCGVCVGCVVGVCARARACVRAHTCMFISACMCVVRRESVPIPLLLTTSEFNVVYVMHHVDGSVRGGGEVGVQKFKNTRTWD